MTNKYQLIEAVQLEKYAQLAVKVGVNIQKGQLLVIHASIEDGIFARLLQRVAYDAGASHVVMDWFDLYTDKLFYLRAADEWIDLAPDWKVHQYEEWDLAGAAYLHIESEHPELFSAVLPERLARFQKSSKLKTKVHRMKMRTYEQRWSIVAVPSTSWATKAFPHLKEDEAVIALWHGILKGARATREDPTHDWQLHGEHFNSIKKTLDDYQFETLHFTNELGTDLKVGLPKNHRYIGGAVCDKQGISFFPNIPTEEVFTAPHKLKVNGKLVASKPLSYDGKVVEHFYLIFKEGRIVDYAAKKGQDVLESLLNMDEGSRYLGEIALVSSQSPLAKTGILFYSTLFDENTASHIGIGHAFAKTLENGDQLSETELASAGLNRSLLLVNITFGTDDMSVIGITNKDEEILIMEAGSFNI